MPKLVNQETLLKEFRVVHKDRYNYSKVVYVNSTTKIEIICNKCERSFFQIPVVHKRGHGCPDCSLKLSQEEAIKNFTKVHGNRYDYSKVDYKNAHEKVEIICNKCGESFLQAPHNHKAGHGCMKCSYAGGRRG